MLSFASEALADEKTHLMTCSVTAEEPLQRLLKSDITIEVNEADLWPADGVEEAAESADRIDADDATAGS